MGESTEGQLDRGEHLADQEFTPFPGVRWSFTGTVAPVQAEGEIDRVPFYFRSRWDRWTFGVASEHQPDLVLVDSAQDGFFRSEKYRPSRFAASWMPLDEAKDIIERCIREYLESLPNGL
jgi:hypothetical protein